MKKIAPVKVQFKGGGYVIVDNDEAFKAQCALPDFETYDDPTKQEIKDFSAHQAFMKLGQKYVDLIEDHVEGRPALTERFRYDTNDILNLMVFMMKNKEPVKKRQENIEVCSREEFKEKLSKKPFEVLPGGADATK